MELGNRINESRPASLSDLLLSAFLFHSLLTGFLCDLVEMAGDSCLVALSFYSFSVLDTGPHWDRDL